MPVLQVRLAFKIYLRRKSVEVVVTMQEKHTES